MPVKGELARAVVKNEPNPTLQNRTVRQRPAAELAH